LPHHGSVERHRLRASGGKQAWRRDGYERQGGSCKEVSAIHKNGSRLRTVTMSNAVQHQVFLLTEPDRHFFLFSLELMHRETEGRAQGVNER